MDKGPYGIFHNQKLNEISIISCIFAAVSQYNQNTNELFIYQYIVKQVRTI